MSPKASPTNRYFWLLIAVSFSLASLALGMSWAYSRTWVELLWHACQTGLQHLQEHLPLAWQLIIPTIVLLMAVRGGLSLNQQLRGTLRLTHLFLPLRETPPARVQVWLAANGLAVEDIVFLNLSSAHAFCLGFWRPRIWLTAGVINLLTDEELAAVLAHEAYHYRQRDPLRLMIGRTLKAAFFFLPLVSDLAQAAELQQEVAADRAAVIHLGSDLPLLCTLQKLLRYGFGATLPVAAYTPFNVTEARLRRLLYPPAPFRWRSYFSGILINLGILLIFSSIALLPAQFGAGETSHCTAEPIASQSTHPHLHPYFPK
ncbi:MAG: M56 family metallopeptidase [Anaerolineae bacterium]|nr:M56 family metallopeptidase [Anaerolineae bacterium]